MTVSPSAIIDYLRINDPEVLQSPSRVRAFLEKNYKSLGLREKESVLRLARKHKYKPTLLEQKLKNSIMKFN